MKPEEKKYKIQYVMQIGASYFCCWNNENLEVIDLLIIG